MLGNVAYLANIGGLVCVDVSNASNPILLGNISTTYEAQGIFIANNIAYVAANYEGLVACNVSNPHNPTFLSSKYNMGYSYDVFINPNTPNLAYVCVDDEGFETYNITNPSNIQYINDIIYGGYMTHSYVVGNIAYVCGAANGLRVVNVSNPAAMVGIGTFTSGTVNFQGIDIVGNTAFLASGSNGVMIANITNPANITKISNVTTYYACGVKVVGNLMFVALMKPLVLKFLI